MSSRLAIGGVGRGLPVRPVSPDPPGAIRAFSDHPIVTPIDCGNGGLDSGRGGAVGGGFPTAGASAAVGGGGGFGTGGGDGGGFVTWGMNRGASGNECRACGEIGHFARDCPTKGGAGGARNCYKCGKEGHVSRDCTESGAAAGQDFGGFGSGGAVGFGQGGGNGACRKCNKEDHMTKDCPDAKCYNCGEGGHMSKVCPQPRKERLPRTCYRCGDEGHISKDCSLLPPPRAEGRKRASTHEPEEIAAEELWHQHIPTGVNFDSYYSMPVEVSGDQVDVEKFIRFESAGLDPVLLQNINHAGFDKPTPIQQHAMPYIMEGRDLIGCAHTGSGKTAAYLVPILNRVLNAKTELPKVPEQLLPIALVIVPTHELAIQIKDDGRKFANGLMLAGTAVKVAAAYGGTSVSQQKEHLKSGCHVLVATPGRLLDWVEQGFINLVQCKFLVLDEADRMLDMGFEPDIRRFIEVSNIPPKGQRQTLMFSATFPREIQELALDFMQRHVFIKVGEIGSANHDIKQELKKVCQAEKKTKLMEILETDLSNGMDEKGKYCKKTIVFVERKRTADFLATLISDMLAPVQATSIHGDREQKEREEAIGDFKNGACPILVATAVASRGLDIKGVDHVVNYDLPQTIDEYVQRIGRTGRIGNPGRATSFYDPVTDKEIAGRLKNTLAEANQEVPEWLLEEVGAAGGVVADCNEATS